MSPSTKRRCSKAAFRRNLGSRYISTVPDQPGSCMHGRQGRYHNARFRQLGEEVGLAITRVPRIGWSGTALASGTATEYIAGLTGLAAAITAYRYAEGFNPTGPGGGDGEGGRGGHGGSGGSGNRPKNGLVLICDCHGRIRVATTVAAPELCGSD
jgi:hypothetical protein